MGKTVNKPSLVVSPTFTPSVRHRQSITFSSPNILLINILNPKLSIFFLAFLPLFISSGAQRPTLQLILLSAVFMGMTLVIFVLYGLFAHAVRHHLIASSRRTRLLQRSFALVFAALGVELALTRQ